MNLPSLLCVLRMLLAVPVCVLIAVDTASAAGWALGLYIVACVTDYLDGAIARRFDMVTDLGRMLDHIADKLLVTAVLVTLVATGHIGGLTVAAAILLISRELFISGMREHLAGRAVVLTVTWTAKWKTTVQMLALGFLIGAPAAPLPPPVTTSLIGTIGLWLAAVLSLVSGYAYVRAGMAAESLPDPRCAGGRAGGRKQETP